jgi:hypothetical protein
VASSYILLAAAAVYSLATVPVALHYLDKERFGQCCGARPPNCCLCSNARSIKTGADCLMAARSTALFGAAALRRF